MSLFKVRDFWTFDLDALQLQSSEASNQLAANSSENNEQSTPEGNFIASVGKFKSIGKQDVFVCGDLRGSLYIVQVPIADQRRYNDGGGGGGGGGENQDDNHEDNNSRVSSPTQWDGISSSNSSTSSRGTGATDFENRQLLAATNLHLPIVDLKCGYFTSAIKQSICVLTFNKLILLQVRRHQPIDLMADGPMHNPTSGGKAASTRWIDENLLSHEFEEYIRMDLLAGELARDLVLLDNHAESNLVMSNVKNLVNQNSMDGTANKRRLKSSTHDNSDDDKKSFAKRTSKQIVQQLHLPQRDKIIVQYANQFLITLIDGKKILGHFALIDQMEPQIDVTQSELDTRNNGGGGGDNGIHQVTNTNALKMRQMSCYVGTTPMAHLQTNSTTGKSSSSSSSLVISFSDQQIYCVPMSKLIDLSKQEIMKRVAQNLLHSNRSAQLSLPSETSTQDKFASSHWTSSGGDTIECTTIRVDVESICEWSRELVAMPIQMQTLQRQVKSVSSRGHKDNLIVSQLLIMSRYNLDLYSSDNQHLWSQRFETPLIHVTAYTLDQYIDSPSSSSNEADANKRKPFESKLNYMDQMVCLLCTDSLSSSSDKSNLVIMKEDQIQWSALLNSKPNKVWRLNLARMPGVLAMLDVLQSHLIVSYLGTNNGSSQLEGDELEQTSESHKQINIEDDIVKLEKLLRDETQIGSSEGNNFATSDAAAAAAQHASIDQIQDEQGARLAFDVKLEASGDKWPHVSVRAKCCIRLEQNVTSVIHNIVATLEFDDRLKFDLMTDGKAESMTQPLDVSRPANGCARIQLGNCWPDRREPITFEASFHLWTSKRDNFGISALNKMESCDDNSTLYNSNHHNFDSNLIPKSLKVRVLLGYHETHSNQMVQETSFLLPINLISQLIHIDYSSGNGQDLADVLGNLPNYKRRTIDPATTRTTTKEQQLVYCTDLFLKLDCDLLTLLAEFVEADLICRGGEGAIRLDEQDRRAEILENINLLAQSLDCRLRYKTPPVGMSRQLSEELTLPVIASFALRFGDIYGSIRDNTKMKLDSSNNNSSNVVVWLHICDFSSKDSSIPEELITLHMQYWMRYTRQIEQQDESVISQQSANPRRNLLVSIECDRSLPVLFVMDHLIERAQRLAKTTNLRLNSKLITTNDYGTYENFYSQVESGQAHQVAISSELHESLKQVAKFYQVDHTNNLKELRERLAQESCKFQIATTTTLSLAKRLPSLPDDMTQQLVKLSALAKQCQMNLIVTLNELEFHRKLDYEFTKVPRALSILKLDPDDTRKPVQDWPEFSSVLD